MVSCGFGSADAATITCPALYVGGSKSGRVATGPKIGSPKQPDRAHPAEFLADSVRTGRGHTPSDLGFYVDSDVEAERIRPFPVLTDIRGLWR